MAAGRRPVAMPDDWRDNPEVIPGEAIIDLDKCPECGDAPERGARSCPACGSRLRQPRKAPKAAPVRPPAHGLSSEELLAKIDALDREVAGTLPPPQVPPAPPAVVEGPAVVSRPWPWLAAAGLAVLGLLALVLIDAEAPPPPVRTEVTAPAPVVPTAAMPSPAEPDQARRLAEVQVEEQRRTAKMAAAVRRAELAAERREEERLVRAREEDLLRLEREFQERRRQAEEARGRAAPRPVETPVPAPLVRRPASPAELCAAEGNLFARGLCENRACASVEWRGHPHCVARAEEQLRRVQSGG